MTRPSDYGLYVVDRRTCSPEDTIRAMTATMEGYVGRSRRSRITLRNRTERLSQILDWRWLGTEYVKARQLALRRVWPKAPWIVAREGMGAGLMDAVAGVPLQTPPLRRKAQAGEEDVGADSHDDDDADDDHGMYEDDDDEAGEEGLAESVENGWGTSDDERGTKVKIPRAYSAHNSPRLRAQRNPSPPRQPYLTSTTTSVASSSATSPTLTRKLDSPAPAADGVVRGMEELRIPSSEPRPNTSTLQK